MPTDKRNVTFSVDGPTLSAVDLTNWANFEGQPNYNYILQKESAWTKGWDVNAEVPYLTKGNFFLSYDDEESIGKKAQYIVDNDLGGVIVWQVHGDIQCEGTFINYGSKLTQCTNLRSPLAEKIDSVFSSTSTPNEAPVLSVPATQSADANQTITFSVSATDADGDVLSFTAANAEITDAGDGSALVTYTAPNTGTDLIETIIVTVSDGRKSVSQNIQVNVKGSGIVVNTPPSLTAPASVDVESGQEVVISVSGTDAEGDALTYTASQGVVVTTATGADVTVSAPATDVATSFTVIVTVSDGEFTTDATVTVNVSAVGGGESTWDSTAVYTGGDSVVHNGVTYQAKWWTQGEEPGTSGVWAPVETGDGGPTDWSASKTYTGGDQVEYQGEIYKAKWWTKGDTPGNSNGPWELI